jgi:hypothetical protein
MKKKSIFFLMSLLATSCATVAVTPTEVTACAEPLVYYTGNDEPAASSLQGTTARACPVYYTGNNEPAGSGLFLASDEAEKQ